MDLRQKHEKVLERMRLKNELDIEKSSLKNELQLQKMENRKSQIGIKREIFKLNMMCKKDDLTKKAGKILLFWGLLGTLVSTCLTMAGGYETFTKNIYTLIGFISGVAIAQFSIFIITAQETRIKQDFSRHYTKCMLLKYILLTFSIWNNFKFFIPDNPDIIQIVMTILLCLAIDFITVFLVSLAYDQKTLNVFRELNKGLALKWFDNATFKVRDSINKKHKENKENGEIQDNKKIVKSVPIQNKTVDLNKYRDTEIKAIDKNFDNKAVDMQYGKYESNYQENENPQNTEIDETRKIGYERMTQVNSTDIEKKNFNKDDVKSYLESMYKLSKDKKNNESVGQTKIEKDAKLTNKQMRFIRGYLEKLNIISVSGKKTFILLTHNKALEKLKAI